MESAINVTKNGVAFTNLAINCYVAKSIVCNGAVKTIADISQISEAEAEDLIIQWIDRCEGYVEGEAL